jgi:hypothetical protein
MARLPIKRSSAVLPSLQLAADDPLFESREPREHRHSRRFALNRLCPLSARHNARTDLSVHFV